MSVADQACFVWVSGLRGPERQKWAMRPSEKGVIDGYWNGKILAVHEITQEEFDQLTLDELAKKFPYPRAA